PPDHPTIPSFPTRRSSDLSVTSRSSRHFREACRSGGLQPFALAPHEGQKKQRHHEQGEQGGERQAPDDAGRHRPPEQTLAANAEDRKSTRLNSSHVKISYA